jgi:hypothetical protein
MFAIIFGVIPAIIIRWVLYKKQLPIGISLLLTVLILIIFAYISHATGVISTGIAGAIGAVTFLILFAKDGNKNTRDTQGHTLVNANSNNLYVKNTVNKNIYNKFLNYIDTNPQKTKALYLVWVLVHFILFLTSGNFISQYKDDFYPFIGYRVDLSDYDYSEFMVYAIIPLGIFYFLKLWRNKN